MRLKGRQNKGSKWRIFPKTAQIKGLNYSFGKGVILPIG